MNQILNPDNPVIRFLGRLFDLVVLNIIFLLLCIPVVTIGASITSLYYVLLKIVRGEDPYILRSFFKAFRQNFFQSTVIWIILLMAAVFLGMDLYVVSSQNTALCEAIRIILWIMCGFFLGIFIYIFPIISHFVCSTKQALKNAALMTFVHLPHTLIMIAVCVAVLYLVMASFKVFAWAVTIGGVCGFSVTAFLFCILFDRIFRKYEEGDKKQR